MKRVLMLLAAASLICGPALAEDDKNKGSTDQAATKEVDQSKDSSVVKRNQIESRC